MSAMDLDTATDELYAGDLEDFIARRSELAKQARTGGDRELAAAITDLRKPSVAAWLVNLLSNEARQDISALLELGAALRHAQARLSAQELRELSRQRQRVVRALTTQAYGIAEDRGHSASRDALDQVSDTLLAALADPEIAERVRAGHLTTPLSYSGFGPPGLSAVPHSSADAVAPRKPPAAATTPTSGPAGPARVTTAAEASDDRRSAAAREKADKVRQDDEARRAQQEREAGLRRARESADAEVVTAQATLAQARRGLIRSQQEIDKAQREIERSAAMVEEQSQRLTRAQRDQGLAAERGEQAAAELIRHEREQQDAEQRMEQATRGQARIQRAASTAQ